MNKVTASSSYCRCRGNKQMNQQAGKCRHLSMQAAERDDESVKICDGNICQSYRMKLERHLMDNVDTSYQKYFIVRARHLQELFVVVPPGAFLLGVPKRKQPWLWQFAPESLAVSEDALFPKSEILSELLMHKVAAMWQVTVTSWPLIS